MAAYIDGVVKCDHEGCKNSGQATFRLVDIHDDTPYGLTEAALPKGWSVGKKGIIFQEKIFLCQDHGKKKK